MRTWGSDSRKEETKRGSQQTTRAKTLSTHGARARGSSGGSRGGSAARSRASLPKRGVAAAGSLKEYPFLRRFYQHQTKISRRVQKILLLLVVATLLYAFVFGDAGAIRIFALKKERAGLVADLARLEAESATLRDEIRRLDNDPFLMEKLGRERYGYVRPGDRVYKLVQPKSDK